MEKKEMDVDPGVDVEMPAHIAAMKPPENEPTLHVEANSTNQSWWGSVRSWTASQFSDGPPAPGDSNYVPPTRAQLRVMAPHVRKMAEEDIRIHQAKMAQTKLPWWKRITGERVHAPRVAREDDRFTVKHNGFKTLDKSAVQRPRGSESIGMERGGEGPLDSASTSRYMSQTGRSGNIRQEDQYWERAFVQADRVDVSQSLEDLRTEADQKRQRDEQGRTCMPAWFSAEKSSSYTFSKLGLTKAPRAVPGMADGQYRPRILETASGEDEPLPEIPFEVPMNHYHAMGAVFWFAWVMISLSLATFFTHQMAGFSSVDCDLSEASCLTPICTFVCGLLSVATVITAASKGCEEEPLPPEGVRMFEPDTTRIISANGVHVVRPPRRDCCRGASRRFGVRIIAAFLYTVCACLAILAFIFAAESGEGGVYGIVAAAAIIHTILCGINVLVEVLTVCYCSTRIQTRKYPCYFLFCVRYGIEYFSTPYRMLYRFTLYQPSTLEMISHSRHVMSSIGVDTSTRPRVENWCNTMWRNICCNGCCGRNCRDFYGQSGRKDKSWQKPRPEVIAEQEQLFRIHATKQRAMGGGATGAGGAVFDQAGVMARMPELENTNSEGELAYARFGEQKSIRGDMQFGDPNTAYADYTSRHHDPKNRSINDRHEHSANAIASGSVPWQDQTPMERRRHHGEKMRDLQARESETVFVPSGGRPSETGGGPLAAEAAELGIPEAEYRRVRAEQMRILADAQHVTNVTNSGAGGEVMGISRDRIDRMRRGQDTAPGAYS